MSKKHIPKRQSSASISPGNYPELLGGVSELLEAARRASARAVNAFLTATYWEIGRRIVEHEQGGLDRAKYGEALIERLSQDLTARFGRGFGRRNVFLMRAFFLACPRPIEKAPGRAAMSSPKVRTASARLDAGMLAVSSTRKVQTVSAESPLPWSLDGLAGAFPLPWSHYVLLISGSRSPEAFTFYQTEALRGGWSVRQLQRQMDSQFYERTALSKDKATMLADAAKHQSGDAVNPDEEIRHPFVLEFLGLRDEYSESDLEDALIRHLESFLLELGNDFAFVGRQRRLRIDDEWYRVDLLFFHRGLRCLVIFDLKLGRFTHADAGQMHVYLNYAREHWVQPGENPPVGVILCSGKSEALVRYATDSLPNKLLVREYLTALPDEKMLAVELEKTRKQLEARK